MGFRAVTLRRAEEAQRGTEKRFFGLVISGAGLCVSGVVEVVRAVTRRRAEEAQRGTEKSFLGLVYSDDSSRSHAVRGNAFCDAPASRNAGAFWYAFPRTAWERGGIIKSFLCAPLCLLRSSLCYSSKANQSSSRSYTMRGNTLCDAPASRDAGASLYAFPRTAWERGGIIKSFLCAPLCLLRSSLCYSSKAIQARCY